MDIADMNDRLQAIHAEIATLRAYQGRAWLDSNMMLYYQYGREIRDLQGDADRLQGEIDSFNKPHVML